MKHSKTVLDVLVDLVRFGCIQSEMKPEQVDAIVANFIKNADATLDSPASPLLLIGLAETQAEIFEATSRLRQNAAGGKVHPDLYAWCINEILVRGLDHDAHDPQAN